MKTKYATETAQAFNKMIKRKKREKIWVDGGTEFLGALKTLCTEREKHLYRTISEKNLLSRKETHVLSKK